MSSRTRVGILGCGMVSHMYLPNLVGSSIVDVAAAADLDAEAAGRVGRQYGIGSASPEELLGDSSVEVIVNLTPIAAHKETTVAALRAGKHVYSEKVLALNPADAAELLAEAQRLELQLACAPDTMLGSSFTAARAAIDAGAIGRPLFASAVMVRSTITTANWYTDGAMPFLDMAPYSVSALVTLFGPATDVTAVARQWPRGVNPEPPVLGAPIALDGVVKFASGATATLSMAWGIENYQEEVARLDVYGSKGIAHLANPNLHSEPAFIEAYGSVPELIEGSHSPEQWQYNLRGIGVIDLALAIEEGRAPRTDAATAAHVVEIITALVAAADAGEQISLVTTMTVPEPIPATELERITGVQRNSRC